jgi:hypothetical protein
MNDGNEHAYVLFHSRARELFFSVFRDFNASIQGVNRAREEHLFRNKQEQYVHFLRQQLGDIALEIIREKQSSTDTEQLSQNLRCYIDDYIHKFVQKVKAL